MTTVTTTVPTVQSPSTRPGRRLRRIPLVDLTPTAFAAANAIAFVLVRPDVNDLWAARARASAVTHGVGLFYWFSWFGGATPGNYSVVTPYLSAWVGTEVLGGLAAVAAAALATLVLRPTTHGQLAAFLAAIGISANLWSGRVPFLLGAVFGLGALVALVRHRRAPAALLGVASVLASPVVAAFLALGLSGTFLCTRTRAFRPVILWTVLPALVGLGVIGFLFGAPGPEPFSVPLLVEMLAGLGGLLLARPPDHLRVTVWVSVLACLALVAIPNGLGSNISRYVWFCLPVAVLALAQGRRQALVAIGTVPIVLVGVIATGFDLREATSPIAFRSYYTALERRLERVPDLANYRVEVVNSGAHAGYDALLGHAALARGWETQADQALNAPALQDPINPVTYKVWLDDNAVGYVALPGASVGGSYPEYTFVASHRARYLTEIWHDRNWQLFRVSDPNPIVPAPARLLGHSQSTLRIRVGCRCSVVLRVRYSKFLTATLRRAHRPPAGAPARAVVRARLADDGYGWTVVTVHRPGVYVLGGSASGLLR